MSTITINARNTNELLAKVQAYLDEQGITTVTKNVYLLPEELADRWRVEKTHLGNLRVSGEGPSFLKLSEGSRARVRYPLFGQGGVLAHEAERTKGSTTE